MPYENETFMPYEMPHSPKFEVTLTLRRQTTWYVVNGFFPMLLVTAVALLTPWIKVGLQVPRAFH